jgi:glycosyltransferase involved in cell wall biosynthesis
MVVGFVESIHAVRAVEPMLRLGWDVHVVGSHPHWPHEAWRNVTLHVDPGFHSRGAPHPSVTLRVLEPHPNDAEPVVEGLSWKQRPLAVAQLIKELQPDIVDSMEIQHGGYVVLEAREHLPKAPPWIVHNWGSDVFYYGRNPRHVNRLKAMFGSCDYYGAECHRDVGLARAFGFSGKVLPILPNPGGFDLDHLRRLRQDGPSSERRTIALKATDSFVYRPKTALNALELCAPMLRGYRLALYSASGALVGRACEIAEMCGMGVDIVSMSSTPVSHEEILAMHGRARISIALADSDAICTSFLEAMAMGSFPIQSNTSCAQEWAECGKSAIFVNPGDKKQVAAAIQRALREDDLVDRAAEINAETAVTRLDREIVLARAMEGYQRVAADVAGDSAWVDFEPEVDDPRWRAERRAEIEQAAQVGWPSGEVAEKDRIERWHDIELIERDGHISMLRWHISQMQRSLNGFHRELEEAQANPSLRVRVGRRLTPKSLRAWVRGRAPGWMKRIGGYSRESGK